MKYLLTEERGASSVMIIFLMLVLAVLGVYSISSAQVNYTFSNKTLAWNREYFECDAQIEKFLMDIDSILAEAEQKTIKEALRQGAGKINYGIDAVTPVDFGEAAAEMQNTYGRLYRRNVLNGLSAFEQYPEMNVSEDGSSVIDITISVGAKARINAKIAVLPLRYSFESIDGEIRGTLDENRKRFMILEWKQHQIIVSSNTQKPLWDGKVE